MTNQFNFMLFNVQNLFIEPFTVERNYPLPPPKTLTKVKELAKIINTQKPDILMLTEVGGEDSLKNFNKQYLNEKYIESIIQGNSDRGIEIGYLIKKGLPFNYDLLTHKNRKLDFNYQVELGLDSLPEHRLSRDIAELRVYKKSDLKKTNPQLIILLVHLKSKLDKDGIDYQGIKRREAEFKLLIETYKILNERYNQKVPIFLAGDFNGNASLKNTDPEFVDLYKETNLYDCMELAKIDEEERYSFIHFPDHYKAERQQLDFILIPKSLTSKINTKYSGVYRFRDPQDQLLPIPTNRSMLYSLPSDHYPLFLRLEDFLLEE